MKKSPKAAKGAYSIYTLRKYLFRDCVMIAQTFEIDKSRFKNIFITIFGDYIRCQAAKNEWWHRIIVFCA